jgi:hypothetical protein
VSAKAGRPLNCVDPGFPPYLLFEMAKTVVYTGADPTEDNEYGQPRGEWERDEEVTDVIIADGVTEIKRTSFWRCTGLTNLSFLEGSAIKTIGDNAFEGSGITSLQGMEGVMEIGVGAFIDCEDLRTIEGLACEEMGAGCFTLCPLLQSMKGWPASMKYIPANCFKDCTGMTTVDCDLSRVTSIEDDNDNFGHAFSGCTSLLSPELAEPDADPAAVLAYLKKKSKDERAAARYAIYSSVRLSRWHSAASLELSPLNEDVEALVYAFAGSGNHAAAPLDPLLQRIALLPDDMVREIIECKLGVVVHV